MTVLLLALAACAPPESIPQDAFAAETADVFCRRTRECLRGGFDSAYYGLSDCTASFERDLQDLVDMMEDRSCAYDAGRAGDAWLEIDEMTCEAFYEGEANEAMAEVWADCSTGSTGYTTYTVYEYTF